MDIRFEVRETEVVLLVGLARCESCQGRDYVFLQRCQEAMEKIEDVIVYLYW